MQNLNLCPVEFLELTQFLAMPPYNTIHRPVQATLVICLSVYSKKPILRNIIRKKHN